MRSILDSDRPRESAVVQRARGGGFAWLVVAGALVAVGSIGLDRDTSTPSPLHRADADPRPLLPAGPLQSGESRAVELFAACAPGVVGITAWSAEQTEQESGAGVVWNRDGYVVTNAHLVRGARSLVVRLRDGSSWDAREVGTDESTDIAVLKIEAPAGRLMPLPLGGSEALRVGQDVYAIGSPFGLDHTLTRGILSGLHREIQSSATRQPMRDVLQTDAAINPGNSGGPLLDSSGRWIGMNTAVAGEMGTSVGVGFAVPSETLNRVVPALIREGRVERVSLGVRIDPQARSTKEVLAFLGPRAQGLVIDGVHRGGPAARAGLLPTRLRRSASDATANLRGDLLRAVDGVPVDRPDDLRRILDRCRAGQTVQLAVTRFEDSLARDVLLSVRLDGPGVVRGRG